MKKKLKILSTALLGTMICIPANADTVYMCQPCPAGYSCNKGVKTICPAGTYSPAVSTSCSKCPEGKISTEGSSSCGSVCLKDDYSILIYANLSENACSNRDDNFTYKTFSGKEVSGKIKAELDKIYYGNFTSSKGNYSIYSYTTQEWNSTHTSTYHVWHRKCQYRGNAFNYIKFHFNNNKGKIEVITNTGSVIAELEATMCE